MKTRVSYLVCARLIGAVVPFVVPAAMTAQATQSADGAYGFVRVVDGSAYLIEASTGQRTDVQANEPLLTGDHVFVAAGYYDFATPYFAADYTFDHLGLDQERRDNVTTKYYEAGHMMYIHQPSMHQLRRDLLAFYQAALAR